MRYARRTAKRRPCGELRCSFAPCAHETVLPGWHGGTSAALGLLRASASRDLHKSPGQRGGHSLTRSLSPHQHRIHTNTTTAISILHRRLACLLTRPHHHHCYILHTLHTLRSP